jgi:hypothetical protein
MIAANGSACYSAGVVCVLVVRIDPAAARPLLVGAVRDEHYVRPSVGPERWDNGIVAPRDLKAGGTWIGVAPSGRVAALTNRREPAASEQLRSRGWLVVEALTRPDPRDWVRRHAADFAGFNLAVLERGGGWVLHYDGATREAQLGPGLHVLSTDRDCDEAGMPEARVMGAGPLELESLPGLLASHEGERPICKHGPVHGTVSATIIAPGDRPVLRHAAGPPCRAPFVDYSRLLASPATVRISAVPTPEPPKSPTAKIQPESDSAMMPESSVPTVQPSDKAEPKPSSTPPSRTPG